MPVYDSDGKLLSLPNSYKFDKTTYENQLMEALIREINILKDKYNIILSQLNESYEDRH